MEKTLNVLTNQLDLALVENSKGKAEMNELKKYMGEMDRENHRLKMQIKDLALQVGSTFKFAFSCIFFCVFMC